MVLKGIKYAKATIKYAMKRMEYAMVNNEMNNGKQ